MEWRQDGTKDFYTLARPEVRCAVWRSTADTWTAKVTHCGKVRTSSNFPTAEAARQWCEQRVLVERSVEKR